MLALLTGLCVRCFTGFTYAALLAFTYAAVLALLTGLHLQNNYLAALLALLTQIF